MRVVYIIGKGRSGSTLVGDFLGSLDGVFHAGELSKLWSYCLLGPHTCSCGERMGTCPIWSQVLAHMASDARSAWSLDRPEEMLSLQRRWLTFEGRALSFINGRSRRKYLDTMQAVYAAIGAVTGCHTLVDGSKWPLDPGIFATSSKIVPVVLHVVKNPRAVAASWRKKKTMPDTGGPMPMFGPVHSAFSWNARVLLAELARRRAGSQGWLLTFEEVEKDPAQALTKLAEALELEGASRVVRNRTVLLESGHTVLGNPTRFQSGPVNIRESGAGIDEPLVSLLTWPLRRRFGY